MGKYPIFIPSKGRATNQLTAKMFLQDGVDFKIVVEPQEQNAYISEFGSEYILTLPENNRGLVYSRNWIRDYAIDQGHERHWQFDDDIRSMLRVYKGRKLYCSSKIAIGVAEEFTDRYENIALTSFNSAFFIAMAKGRFHSFYPPFYLNHRCYTVFLMLNSIPCRWRYKYNEDTDMTLQALATGWCTVLLNAFLIMTPETMTDKGGQTAIYVNDGRLQMARQLERVWPGVVTTARRFGRPQHRIYKEWAAFDTRLKRRTDIEWPKGVDEFGMTLVAREDATDEFKDMAKKYHAK